MKKRVLVLCYHRVNLLQSDINMLAVSVKNFEQHMKFLKNNYNIVRFDDDWEDIDGDSVIISFDDGYKDVYDNAIPILNELEVPTTIFVSNLGRQRELWWDELEYLLLVGDRFPAAFKLEHPIFGCTWATDTYEKRVNCYHALHMLMKTFLSSAEKEQCLDDLWNWRQQTRFVRDNYVTMDECICRRLSSEKNIILGAHTVTHPCLANISKKEQETEIVESIKALEKVTVGKVEYFAYPFGQPITDYNGDTVEILRKSGIKRAGATSEGLWTKKDNLFDIQRNGIRNMDVFEYRNRINRFFED